MTSSRIERIRTRLEEAFSPERLEIIDESHLHVGHVGAESGKGHFRVTIVSAEFDSVDAVARHRMVFDALGEMMDTEIHALSVSARAPGPNSGNTLRGSQ